MDSVNKTASLTSMLYGTAYLDNCGRPSLLIQGDSIAGSIPTELDFIEAITGRPNLTHAGNRFRLRPEVVAKELGL